MDNINLQKNKVKKPEEDTKENNDSLSGIDLLNEEALNSNKSIIEDPQTLSNAVNNLESDEDKNEFDISQILLLDEPECHDFDFESQYLTECLTNDAVLVDAEMINEPILKVDKNIQVTSGDFLPEFCRIIKNEKDLMTMCNIKSFAILNQLTHLMKKIYPDKKKHILNVKERIIVTTTKLKLDVTFAALACIYNVENPVTIRNVFYDTLKKLARILQSVVKRVSKEEILRNMPKSFSQFVKTTSVLDCTEIRIEKPKCLKCQIRFYSNYKKDLTVKFMTEITPGGILTFASEAYGGRASDKCIFEQSKILNYLESSRDAVMVDKGFLIDDECQMARIQLIRPPFLRKKNNFHRKKLFLIKM